MQSYTYGSDEGHAAIVAALPEHYDMSLNRGDMAAVLDALRMLADRHDIIGTDNAASLYGSIAETVGVELI